MSVITQTGFILPLSVISNGQVTGNPFQNPNNILFADDLFAEGNSTADIIVGNFNFNLPSDAVVTGIEFKVKGKRGQQITPPVTLTFYAVDNTSGTDIFYPYIAPFTGLTLSNTVHSFGTSTYQFATSFTADQVNNLKLQIVSDGQVFIDDVLMNVYYYVPSTITPTPSNVSGCADCNSPIQVQEMFLQLPFLIGEDKFYLKPGSWQYPDGTPVQPGDVGSCGGEVVFVFDEGKAKMDGQNFEENAVLNINSGSWTVLPSGVIEFDIGSVTNRGRQFHTPYAHDPLLMSDHSANSKVVISNSGLFYSRFVRRCEVDITFSAPVSVYQNGAAIVDPFHHLNFLGAGVSVVQNPLDPFQADITIPGTGVSTPVVVDTVSNDSGNVQVLTLNLNDLNVQGINRGVLVQISTEEAVTVSSVVGNGTENFIQIATDDDVVNNIRGEQWLLVAPTAGLMDIVITLSAPAYISAGAEAYVSVDQSNPTGTIATDTGSSNTPSVTNITANDNSIVVDSLATAQLPILYTKGTNQVLNWSRTANPVTRQGGSSYQLAGTAPDNVIMSWTMTQNTPWVMTSVELNGIPAVAPIVSPLTVEDITATTSVPNTVKIVVPDTHLNSTTPGEANITFQNVLETISQTGHGFTVGQVVRSSGTDGEYTLSQADSASNSEVAGIVSQVIDVDTFVLVTEGLVVLSSGVPGGAVAGDIIYLDDSTAGALTLTAPSTAGTIVHKLGEVIDAGTGLIYFHNYLGLTQDQVNPPSGLGVGSEQNLGGAQYDTGSTVTATLSCITSTTDGSVLFATFRNNTGGNDLVLYRFERDTLTGQYFLTHGSISSTGIGNDSGGGSIVVIGIYVYVIRRTSGLLNIDRFLASDLTGQTTMTTGTPAFAGGTGGAFTDGTDMFINLNDGAGTWTRYTISGTTITSAGTITGGMTGVVGSFYDGGTVFMIDNTSTVNSYTYTTTFSLVNTAQYRVLNLGAVYDDVDNIDYGHGFANIGSGVFYIGYSASFSDGTSSGIRRQQNLVIKPFTKPL